MDKQKYQNVAIFVSSASLECTVTCTGSAIDPGPHLFGSGNSDPYWECGSGSTSKESKQNLLTQISTNFLN